MRISVHPGWLVVILLFLAACTPAVSRVGTPTVPPPAIVLVSLDGFRWDYLDRGETPNLQRLADHGVRAERLIPVFPSLTFPNHYTIVTGLYPEHHGIVSNTMRDSVLGGFRISDTVAVRDARWWGGEPVWRTVERQGRHAAAFFWPGSEAPIGGSHPWRWMPFDDRFPAAARVDSVLAWLSLPADQAPAIVTLYYSDADHAGHDSGPASAATDAAIMRVDSMIGRLMAGIASRGLGGHVNLIVVSDHGMLATPKEQLIRLDDYIALDDVEVIDWSPVGEIVPKAGKEAQVYRALRDADPHLRVYRKAEVPARLHFSAHPRIAPLVLVADAGWSITTRARAATWRSVATHGWDPATPEMGAIFVAGGPAFREGVRVPAFENVHIYALLCHLLGTRPAPNDGSLDSIRAVLR